MKSPKPVSNGNLPFTHRDSFIPGRDDLNQAIMNTIGAIVMVTDPDGIVCFFNKTAEAITGYKAEEILGKYGFDVLVPPDMRSQIVDLLQVQNSSDLPRSGEGVLLTKGGDNLVISWTDNGIYKSNGELEYLIFTGIDITNRKEIEQQLLEARDNLETEVEDKTTNLRLQKQHIEFILDAMNNGVIVLDDKGNIMNVNRSFRYFYHQSLDKVFPTGSINITDLPKDNQLTDTIREFMQNSKAQSQTIEISPDLFLKLETDGQFIQDKHGTPIKVIELYDVTRFIELDSLRNKFIATASHELRTPTTVILQCLNNMKKYKTRLNPEQKDNLFLMLDRNANLLAELIEDLLTLSRIDQNRIQLEMTEFHLQDLINKVVQELEPLRQTKNMNFTIIIPSKLKLYGDPKKISQVFRILCENALKYSDSNKEIKITVQDKYKGSYNPKEIPGCLIEVEDQGIGIRSEDLKHIFKRFFRAEISSKVEGTGLGLSIARDLTRLHQGDIYVTSQWQKGTKFSVFLPFQKNAI